MALPDYPLREAGTPIIFGQPSASGVTHDITLDALAAGSARMSEYADLGQYPPADVVVDIQIETGTAPTAAGTVDVYVLFSDSTSVWPGGTTGADGAWPPDGNEDEWAKQLAQAFVGSLVATNDGSTNQIQARLIVPVLGRYMLVVVDNNLDQAIRNEATDTDNTSRITVTPWHLRLSDTSAA